MLLGYAVAFWLVSSEKNDIAHYRTLSHDALLAELAKKSEANFDTDFAVSLVLLGGVVLCVDAVAVLVELVINRISPPEPARE
jgi:hypothetical protein